MQCQSLRLDWLPAAHLIDFKIQVITFEVLLVSDYISELLLPYQPASDRTAANARWRTKGHRASAIMEPPVNSGSSFKSFLKTRSYHKALFIFFIY